MTEIFRKQDSATIGHLQSLLEAEGIQTCLRNEFAATTTIAVPDVTPALCVLDDADAERAIKLIREYLGASSTRADEELTCANCGERSPGTFAVCWQCGASLEAKA